MACETPAKRPRNASDAQTLVLECLECYWELVYVWRTPNTHCLGLGCFIMTIFLSIMIIMKGVRKQSLTKSSCARKRLMFLYVNELCLMDRKPERD